MNKTNQYKQQYFTDNHYEYILYTFHFTKEWLVVVKTCETNTRILLTRKDFPVYKFNGIPFAAHLAKIKVTPHFYGLFLF